jgi:hypothetical protein
LRSTHNDWEERGTNHPKENLGFYLHRHMYSQTECIHTCEETRYLLEWVNSVSTEEKNQKAGRGH